MSRQSTAATSRRRCGREELTGRTHASLALVHRAHARRAHRRPRPALPLAPDHADRPLPARRLDRHHRAHHGGAHASAARPADRDRECRRRGRLDRGRPRRARTGRRLHHRHRPVGHACRQHHLQAQLRSGEGLRAGRPDLGEPATPRRAQEPAGEHAAGAGRADEEGARQGHVRQPERRRACLGHPAAAADADRSDVHPLSRRRPRR